MAEQKRGPVVARAWWQTAEKAATPGLAELTYMVKVEGGPLLEMEPVTLGDALAGNANAGDPQNFDTLRHRGRMNIGFFDGHVETRNISVSDLQSVYLIAPK